MTAASEASLSRRRLRAAAAARARVTSSEHFTGWAFVTPGVAIILLFGAVPVVWSAVMSFQRNNLLSPDTPYVGLHNYRTLVHDPVVAQAVEHTLVYTALFVPGSMIVGLFLAVAMNRNIRFINFYRTAAYATMAISTISEALVFIWLFDPSYGVVNYLFSLVGIPQQQFLNSPSEALYVIVAMTIWGWTGFSVVIYLAALQGDPAAPDRRGGDRRGERLGDVPAGDAAAAQPGVAVPGGLAHDQRAAAVRRGLPEHAGRPAEQHHRARVLPV